MKYQILGYTPHDGTDAWTVLYDSGNFYSGQTAQVLPTYTWDGYNFDFTINAANPYNPSKEITSTANLRVSAAASSHDYKIYWDYFFGASYETYDGGSYPEVVISNDKWPTSYPSRYDAPGLALPISMGTVATWLWNIDYTDQRKDYWNDSAAAIFVVRNATHTHLPLFDPATGLLMRGSSQILRDE